ncbi:helix-turn-helix domain-containing protein [Dactylosporangium aurantiacum]|uniref:Helix-turn-helix domain-containing protein n=1 Tax=Dactylosporangium aurantiacum TaxID=35754 RepID=A0A9Q9IEW6_9ACTN|nr:helix-turn-helix domain-containing protein [Dactylosporangium aurantiacum]MDG6109576.1 helix-turn-helix domain-containing protein [Dactylosporangium aurantiacum]UWZ51270.1 helix-turn-helix domain-containing protein [Dactylosporangium aurantiacum]
MSPFAELLRRHRTAAGLGQRELATRSGLSERAVRALEGGSATQPRRHSVVALADALRLTGPERAAFAAAAFRPGAAPAVMAPPAPDAMVGRDEDLRWLTDLVLGGRHRIVTVTGPGGVGKSRLAAELVAGLRRREGLEVYAVDCATLAEPGLAGELIAEAVGCGGASRLPAVERIAVQLRSRRVLLVLDGFERLVAAAPEVAGMVTRCPGLTVLVTSQRALRLRGERQVRLEPLPASAAVELFARRAAEAAPGFAVTGDNAGPVAAICRTVDGLPLALELAAARMRLLTPAELLARLDRPLRELAGGAADLPERHRSLRATITASLQVVGAAAGRLFTWLAAFPAGVRPDDLQAVVDRLAGDHGGSRDGLLDAVAELVDAHLLRVRNERDASRYVLPDTMREMAGELLAAGRDEAATRRAAAEHYLGRLRAAAARPDGAGYGRLDADVDNVRAALWWARRHAPDVVDAATVDAWYRYSELRGRFTEARGTLTALAGAGVAGSVRALLRAARCAQALGDFDDAARLATRAVRALPPADHGGHALAALVLGISAAAAGDLDAAVRHDRDAVRAAEAAGDDRALGHALNNLAGAHVMAGDLTAGERCMRAALVVKQRAGTGDVDIGRTLMNLAEIALHKGDWPGAATLGARADAALERGGHAGLRVNALSGIAVSSLAGGDLAAAVSAMDRALALFPVVGDDQQLRGMVRARQSLIEHAGGRAGSGADALAEAVTALRVGRLEHELAPIVEAHAALAADREPATAARLLGVVLALGDRHDHRQPPLIRPAAATGQRCRTALGAARFDHERRTGARLLTEDDLGAGLRELLASLGPSA